MVFDKSCPIATQTPRSVRAAAVAHDTFGRGLLLFIAWTSRELASLATKATARGGVPDLPVLL